MPSPTCTVNSTATTSGVNVSAASTVNIALSDTAGVTTWTLECIGRDDDASAPTITVNSVNKTATFTSGAAGSAYILKSTVNGGRDANGTLQTSYSTTFAVYVLVGGARVVASNETTEGNATHGWVEQVNACVRRAEGYGTYANRPAAGNAGRLYTCSDSLISQWVDDGSAWRPLVSQVGKEVLAVSNFSWFNQGGCTATDSGGRTLILTDGATGEISGLVRDVSTPASFDARAKLVAHASIESQYRIGMALKESAGDKFIFAGIEHTYTGATYLKVLHYTNAGTLSATAYSAQFPPLGLKDAWFRIYVYSGTAYFMVSSDGVTWITFHSQSAATFITIAKAGFAVSDAGDTVGQYFSLLSWEVT